MFKKRDACPFSLSKQIYFFKHVCDLKKVHSMKKSISIILIVLLMLVSPFTVHATETIDFKELFDKHKSVMLIIHPLSGDIYYANSSAASFYGYPVDVLLTMNINDINTLTPEEVAEERLRALEEKRNFFVFKHELASGEIKTVHVYSYPIDIDDETYLFSIIIDQTPYILFQKQQSNMIALLIILLGLGLIIVSAGFLVIKSKNKNLIESEQRFKALHNASFGGIAIHDRGLIIECNEGLSKMTGYSIEELIGMNGLLLIEPSHRDYVMNNITFGYEMPYESVGIGKNGETFPVRIEARNIPYREKQVRVTEFRDITVLKKQEEDKLAIETQWKHLVEAMPLGFNIREMIWDKQSNPIDYRFISINDAYETITGLKRQDIINKTVREVLPNIEQYWIDKYSKVVKYNHIVTIEEYSRDLDKYFKVVAYPFKNNQFVAVVEDVSERRLYEQQLIQMENEKSRIINNLPGVSFKCKFDDNWTMLYLSDYFETLTGYTKSEVLNNNVISYKDMIVLEYREKVMKTEVKSRERNQTCQVEYELVRKDGKRVWVWEKGKAFLHDGEWFIEGFLMDITNRKQYEENILYTSKHDFLTGLPNRRFFDEVIKKLDKPKYHPLLIAMIDIDGLKLINDTYGHKIGDQVIREVAVLLKDCCGDTSFIARVGGDEFLIISPNTSVETFKKKRNNLLLKIAEIKIKDIQLSLSFGIAIKTNTSEDIEDVITNAENNLYANKVLHGQSLRNQVIIALFDALKEKYEEERYHSDRVSRYCVLMGEELNLTQNEKLELELAGRMHDIGKITIPDQILKKPGALTDEEWEIMKNHTTNGYQILRSADQYSELAEYALTHHERIDGKGYPQGLVGEDIPLFSRIIGICDAYEAMTADRPYRKALSNEVAIEELERCAGTQFDSKLVKIFVKKVLTKEQS